MTHADQDQPMDRSAMMAALEERGFDTSLITDDMPDELLAEILRCGQPDQDQGDGSQQYTAEDLIPAPAGAKTITDATLAEGCSKMDDMDSDRGDVGGVYADDSKDNLDNLPRNKGSSPMVPVSTPYAGNTSQLATAGASKHPKNIKISYGELKGAISQIVREEISQAIKGQQTTLQELNKFSEEQRASNKRAMVTSFVEAELKSGRIKPFELDDSDPNRRTLFQRLMAADSRQIVHKFKDAKGQTVEKTELDLQMDEIRSHPVGRFSELTRAGDRGQANGTAQKKNDKGLVEDEEVDKVRTFAEENRKDLETAGTSVEKFCERFQKKRTKQPDYTAAEYLGA
jgi:hypothetical protein